MRNLGCAIYCGLTGVAAGVKRDHSQAALVAEFARVKGKARRTAQWNRKNDTSAWREFLASKGLGDGVQLPATVDAGNLEVLVDPRPLYDRPYEELSPAEKIEADQWALYQGALNQARLATKSGDSTGAGFWTRATAEAYKAYRDARRDRMQADQEERKLVPVAEFETYRALVARVAQLVKGMGRELAAQVNPENPHQAMAVFDRFYKERWNPQVAELMNDQAA